MRLFQGRHPLVSDQRGFTLWEVILVLIIFGMMAFLALPSFVSVSERVHAEVNKSNILMLERAVKLYHMDLGSYPDSLDALLQRPYGQINWRGPYLEVLPENPYDPNGTYSITDEGNIISE
jgi:general secretion pathway protein G